jgi:monoterpene epsilon-lactone hydrolase
MSHNDTDVVPIIPKPSLRGRILTRLVRVVVKRWARGDPPAVVRRARQVFGFPNFLNFLYSGSLEIQSIDTGQVQGEWLIPKHRQAKNGVLLYFHGGGYVSCSPQTHRPITTALARLTQCCVFSLKYRLAPEHPFPAAVDDAAAAFQWLVESGVPPEKIAVAGDSAGGGLAIAVMLRLRERGLALPACAIGLSPWVDLTGGGKYRNTDSCAMFQPKDVAIFSGLYLNGASPESPEASPVFADLTGLPPLLIHASSTELLLHDAVLLHEKALQAGVKSTLSVYPGLPHAWQIFFGVIPEARIALEQIASFISAAFNGPAVDGIRPSAAATEPVKMLQE